MVALAVLIVILASEPSSQTRVGPTPLGPAAAHAQPPSEAADAPLLTLELAPDERHRVTRRGETFLTGEYELPYTAGPVILSGDPAPATPYGIDDYLLIVVRRPDGTTARWERTFNPLCIENDVIPPDDIRALFQPGLNTITVTIADLCGFSVGTLGRVLISTPAAPVRHSLLELLLGSPLLWTLLVLGALGTAGKVVLARSPQIRATLAELRWRWSDRAQDPGAGVPIPPPAATGVLLPPRSAPARLALRPQRALLLLATRDAEDQPDVRASAQQIELRQAALTIGSRSGCDIQLPAVAGIAPEHARLWLAGQGRVMVHQLTARPAAKGGPGEGSDPLWVALSVGDEFPIGPYLLRYVNWAADPEAPPPTSAMRPRER
jgi:hypothetical protein